MPIQPEPLLDIVRGLSTVASFAIVVDQLKTMYSTFFMSCCSRCRGTGMITCQHCHGTKTLRRRPAFVRTRDGGLVDNPADCYQCYHCGPPTIYDFDPYSPDDETNAMKIQDNLKAAVANIFPRPFDMGILAGTQACPQCRGSPRVHRLTPDFAKAFGMEDAWDWEISRRRGRRFVLRENRRALGAAWLLVLHEPPLLRACSALLGARAARTRAPADKRRLYLEFPSAPPPPVELPAKQPQPAAPPGKRDDKAEAEKESRRIEVSYSIEDYILPYASGADRSHPVAASEHDSLPQAPATAHLSGSIHTSTFSAVASLVDALVAQAAHAAGTPTSISVSWQGGAAGAAALLTLAFGGPGLPARDFPHWLLREVGGGGEEAAAAASVLLPSGQWTSFLHAVLRVGRWALVASSAGSSAAGAQPEGQTEQAQAEAAWHAAAAAARQQGGALPDAVPQPALPPAPGIVVRIGALWEVNGRPDLDIQAAAGDIRLAPDAPRVLPSMQRWRASDLGIQRCLAAGTSLRTFLSLLYLRWPDGLRLSVCGVPVLHQHFRVEVDEHGFAMQHVVKVQLGRLAGAPGCPASGVCVYHRGRLVAPLLLAGKLSASVFGWVEADFLEPLPGGQGLQPSHADSKFEAPMQAPAPDADVEAALMLLSALQWPVPQALQPHLQHEQWLAQEQQQAQPSPFDQLSLAAPACVPLQPPERSLSPNSQLSAQMSGQLSSTMAELGQQSLAAADRRTSSAAVALPPPPAVAARLPSAPPGVPGASGLLANLPALPKLVEEQMLLYVGSVARDPAATQRGVQLARRVRETLAGLVTMVTRAAAHGKGGGQAVDGAPSERAAKRKAS
eukprot:scaffold5.g898.t1